jgi:AcrR family transcriptional regulator
MFGNMRTRNEDLNEARRVSILKAASGCFVQSGFQGTSMKDICAAAGMSPGTLYHFFASKDDIIAGIIEQERSEMRDLVAPLAEADDIVSALFDTLDAIAKLITDADLRLHTEVTAEILRQPKLTEQAQQADQETIDALAAALRLAQKKGTMHGRKALKTQIPSLKQAIARILIDPDAQ